MTSETCYNIIKWMCKFDITYLQSKLTIRSKQMPKSDNIKSSINGFLKELDEKNVGAIVIPFVKDKKDLPQDLDDIKCSDFVTNISDDVMVKLALTKGLNKFASGAYYGKTRGIPDQSQATDLAMQLVGGTALNLDDEDWRLVLSVRTADIAKAKDNDTLIFFAPKGLNEIVKNSELLTGGCLATFEPEDFAHAITIIVLSYCAKNNIDVEQYMNDIFKNVMTANFRRGN